MPQRARNKSTQSISTDAKFWLALLPFLLGAVAGWGYLVSWIVSMAPSFIPVVVSFFASWT